MLTALLVDDEPDSLRLLARELENNCPQVSILGQFSKAKDALHAIQTKTPDIVFLDIEMPEMNGFMLLEQIPEIAFHIVFITAYDEFAVRAFRYSALDYLLKPLDAGELREAVRKAESRQRIDPRQLNLLRSQWMNTALPTRMAVPNQGGVHFVDLQELLYAQSESNYTRLILRNGQAHLLSKTLREVQQVLEGRNFLRVHRQYLVNLDRISSYHKGDSAYLVMDDGKNIPVSKDQKERLTQRFGWL